MIRSRMALYVCALCSVLIGMFAFSSAAQAEENASWLVNGTKLSGGLEPTLEGEVDTKAIFLTELGGKQLHIICVSVRFVVMRLVPSHRFIGRIRFFFCVFFVLTKSGTLEEVKSCEPAFGGEKGVIETNSVTGLIKLHEGAGAIEVRPAEAGKPIAILSLGEECAFGENITLEGVLFLKDSALSTNAVKHLFEELKALSKLTVNGGTKTASLDGSIWAFLGGSHAGLTFSGQPG